MSQEFPRSTIADNGSTYDPYANSVCTLCQKILSADGDPNGDLEAIGICGDCKFLFLEDIEAPPRESRRRRRTTRHGSNESIESIFSQQFSHTVNRVRQNQIDGLELMELMAVGDSVTRFHQRTSTRTTPSGSGRWRRVLSDTESDAENESIVSFGPQRLFHGENDAVSFTTYGGESDMSVDLNGFLDQNDGSDFDSDTDIDPMNAGLDHWNSEDDDGEWEEEEEDDDNEEEGDDAEGDVEQATDTAARAVTSRTRSIFTNAVWMPEFGDLTDYLDSRGLEEFLLHLAEEDGSRRGAPPASASFVNSLPRVVIEKGHEKFDDGGLACAICKDVLAVGTEANRLPCGHLYHHSCISPWLATRNSCPLCRYELPTDDTDYEEGKRSAMEIRNIPPIVATDDSSVTFSDGEEEHMEVGSEVSGPARESGRGRWLFLAAAPIVGLVGIVLVLWLGNLRAEGGGGGSARNTAVLPDHGLHHIHIAGDSSGRRESRSRRWWSFF